ncbi:hypothetical protein QP185_15990 [Sphingomonas aerolata]|uniref:hypothetical protein n=1 Tax=Sphingomonas aerolata TaxID=185951 RepID=UPI002FE08AB1
MRTDSGSGIAAIDAARCAARLAVMSVITISHPAHPPGPVVITVSCRLRLPLRKRVAYRPCDIDEMIERLTLPS